MGNATSLVNLMRNVGSSIGIAVVTTVLANRRAMHTQVLAGHINAYSPTSSDMLAGLQAYFRSRGADAATAAQQSIMAARGMVARQAAMLSFIDAFYLMGLIFLAMLPLLFLMQKPGPRGGPPIVASD